MASDKYIPTIGLEIHAELKTQTKMFCSSRNDSEESRPNANICPVCMGYPGTLPVINKQAVKNVLKMGLAVNGKLADYTEFDRKNYFYPDIPKGYQISQYKYPLVSGGELAGVKLTRIHLEEDTARSTHHGNYSLVDFNRAGVPLMELVTEPVIKSATEAGNFARELQLLLQTLGISDANMEKGEMRVEANISVSKDDKLGTKVEVKNLNSFRAAERAIEYEVKRQIEALEKGEKLVQETRGWDENKQTTFSQRSKESSHDYRYFPDPDLPKLVLSEMNEMIEELRKELPELPSQKRDRLAKDYGIKAEDIESYVRNENLREFFEGVVKELSGADQKTFQLASNYLTSDVLGLLTKQPDLTLTKDLVGKLPAKEFAMVVKMAASGDLGSRGAKDLIAHLINEGGEAESKAKELNLLQTNDVEALKVIIDGIIKEHESVVKDYKAGKESALQFLIGQAMKATKGSANPQTLKEICIEELK